MTIQLFVYRTQREVPPHLSKFFSSGVIKNGQLPLVEFMARTLVSSALASHLI
jgi:hypothetical protein